MINRIIDFARNRILVSSVRRGCCGRPAGLRMNPIPLDAIPDLCDTQVIVYSRWDWSPDILEDQVTYPIATAMLGVPKVKDIRGFSDFGYSYVYIIFEEGTDIYWARSRTLEYLSNILPRLPQEVKMELARTRPVSAGSFSTRWWIKPESATWPNSAPSRTGACGSTCNRSPASPKWPPSGGSSASTR